MKGKPLVPATAWVATIILIVALLAFDYFFHVRKAHVPSLREAGIWSAVYIGIALLFGVLVTVLGGAEMGEEYFAGYITEKALSVDNLFVFLIIMSSFAVPRATQQKVLLFGIIVSLVARTAFILIGTALITHVAWVFYVFGLILFVTAGHTLRSHGARERGDQGENIMIRLARRTLRTSAHYDGDRLVTTVSGRRMLTPLVVVMAAIGGTDILFALDSIPAIFGLTQSTFVAFTATILSLLGLRQLYFLIDGLLDRLVYLSYGLSGILAFIGVKLVLHALHENNVPFINGGRPLPVVEIPTPVSLVVIIAILTVTVTASLVAGRRTGERVPSGTAVAPGREAPVP